MRRQVPRWAFLLILVMAGSLQLPQASAAKRFTEVSLHGASFFLNGRPTYEGRTWHDKRIEGLMLNARLVQGRHLPISRSALPHRFRQALGRSSGWC